MPRRSAVIAATRRQPPVAAIRPHDVVSPHGTRIDPYYWLRDDTRQNPEMLAYLEAENAYTQAVLASTEPLQATLFAELAGRLQQDEDTLPYRRDGYWYYRRYETGREYDRLYRRKGSMTGPEELLLDLNELARGHEYFHLGAWDVSPDGTRLAWTEDTVSRRQFTLHLRDLTTGERFRETVANISAEVVLGERQPTLFYVEKGSGHLARLPGASPRSGLDPAADPVVYEEHDRTFYTGIDKIEVRTRTCRSSRTAQSPLRCVWSTSPRPASRSSSFLPRERDHEYDVDRSGRQLRRAHQLAGEELPPDAGAEDQHRRSRDLARARRARRRTSSSMSFEVFRDFLAIAERSTGLPHVRVMPGARRLDGALRRLRRKRLTSWTADTPELDSESPALRLTSLTHAGHHLRVRHADRRRARCSKQQAGARRLRPVALRDRVAATPPARDGTQVPVSLVYRKGFTPRRHRAAAPLRPTARTALERPELRPRRRVACSIAASSTPSPTSAAARRWAAPGTRTASC